MLSAWFIDRWGRLNVALKDGGELVGIFGMKVVRERKLGETLSGEHIGPYGDHIEVDEPNMDGPCGEEG